MSKKAVFILLLPMLITSTAHSLPDNQTTPPADTNKTGAKIDTRDSTIRKHKQEYSRMVRIDAGFAHWTSDRFRTAILGKDLAFGIGVNPGIPYLQLQGRFAYSTIRTVPGDTVFADFNGRFVGFTNLGLALCNTFTKNVQTVMVSYGAGVVLVGIKGRPLATGLGGGIGVDYLIRHPTWKHFSMGVCFNLQSQTYNISGKKAEFKEWFSADKVNLDRDLNVTLGYVVAFF
jgi:hypothetical protein